MRCLFCKQDTTDTKSVEHIIPESLGNKTFVLPLGYVCDKCNNYFARAVERPFLELPEIELLRSQEEVPSKKNRIPTINGLFNGIPVKLKKKVHHGQVIKEIVWPPENINEIFNIKKTKLIFPAFTNDITFKNNTIISRFIAKVALEALADKLKSVENSLNDLIDDIQFDAIRNYARLGNLKEWPCNIRRIYEYDKSWIDKDNTLWQKIHESDFLIIKDDSSMSEQQNLVPIALYFVVALYGIEFAINMAGPEIDGYKKWLIAHNNVSPLYYGKNENSDDL